MYRLLSTHFDQDIYSKKARKRWVFLEDFSISIFNHKLCCLWTNMIFHCSISTQAMFEELSSNVNWKTVIDISNTNVVIVLGSITEP